MKKPAIGVKSKLSEDDIKDSEANDDSAGK